MNASPQVQEWVAAWKRADRALAKVKRDELRRVSTPRAIEQLEGPLRYALKTAKPTRTSGLVEQQRIFKTLRHG